jgi:hypothetical protein
VSRIDGSGFAAPLPVARQGNTGLSGRRRDLAAKRVDFVIQFLDLPPGAVDPLGAEVSVSLQPIKEIVRDPSRVLEFLNSIGASSGCWTDGENAESEKPKTFFDCLCAPSIFDSQVELSNPWISRIPRVAIVFTDFR